MALQLKTGVAITQIFLPSARNIQAHYTQICHWSNLVQFQLPARFHVTWVSFITKTKIKSLSMEKTIGDRNTTWHSVAVVSHCVAFRMWAAEHLVPVVNVTWALPQLAGLNCYIMVLPVDLRPVHKVSVGGTGRVIISRLLYAWK